MDFLGSKKNTIFIGQAVEVPGTAMYNTLNNVPKKKLLELPVAEEMQMGISLGLAMDGNVPISIFPRWNFLLHGINQLINHIDKFKLMAGNKLKPKIIVSLQANSPEVKYKDLDNAINFFKKAFPLKPIKEVISVGKDNLQNGAFRIMTPNAVCKKTLSTNIGIYKTNYIDIHDLNDYKNAKKKIEKN